MSCNTLNGTTLNSDYCRYLTYKQKTDCDAVSAQLYYMTDSEPYYSREKCVTFPLAAPGDSYVYKLCLHSLEKWEGQILMFRLDPAHYPATWGGTFRPSQFVLSDFAFSDVAPIYDSKEDFTGRQFANQWTYCVNASGISDRLPYDPAQKVYGTAFACCIGDSFQIGTEDNTVSREWTAVDAGSYAVSLSGVLSPGAVCTVIIEDAVVLKADRPGYFHVENRYMLDFNSVLKLTTAGGKLADISLRIHKEQDCAGEHNDKIL